jgi:hypothetical protein
MPDDGTPASPENAILVHTSPLVPVTEQVFALTFVMFQNNVVGVPPVTTDGCTSRCPLCVPNAAAPGAGKMHAPAEHIWGSAQAVVAPVQLLTMVWVS